MSAASRLAIKRCIGKMLQISRIFPLYLTCLLPLNHYVISWSFLIITCAPCCHKQRLRAPPHPRASCIPHPHLPTSEQGRGKGPSQGPCLLNTHQEHRVKATRKCGIFLVSNQDSHMEDWFLLVLPHPTPKDWKGVPIHWGNPLGSTPLLVPTHLQPRRKCLVVSWTLQPWKLFPPSSNITKK